MRSGTAMSATKWFTLLFVVLAAVALWGIRDLDYWAFDGPGPKLLPLWVSIIMIASAAWIIARPAREDAKVEILNLGPVAGYVALVAAAIVVFATAGALAAMLVFIIAELILIEKKPIIRSVVLGVACTTAIYVVFVLMLHMQLPGYGLTI